MKGRRNPDIKLLKQTVTIRLDRQTVQYFKDLADSTDLPYQSLINMYLRECRSPSSTNVSMATRESNNGLTRQLAGNAHSGVQAF
jgi:hypothetical protein